MMGSDPEKLGAARWIFNAQLCVGPQERRTVQLEKWALIQKWGLAVW